MKISNLIHRLMHVYWRFSRPMTLGVRALVQDDDGRILLVKHTYVAGWHMPGGGVEAGETLEEALAKELREEANLVPECASKLVGLYLNTKASRRDHVALFHITKFQQPSLPSPNHEIAECRWFVLDELPDDTTAATLRRIDEVLNAKIPNAYW
ncbi:MAG: NUDIX domain-containing protein [Rhizobiaceae bacterium]|nr:NUDIX domain-containing protein [Rhizobiaceae bacterium]